MPGDGSSAPAPARPAGPYVGLRHYTEADGEWFFGREQDCQTIIANLRAARLTVLYARSGVGKSSLLRAGVARQLHSLAERRLAARGTPGYLPVVFSAWKDDPVEELIAEIENARRRYQNVGSQTTRRPTELRAAIEQTSSELDAKLLIILDQFEEYLLYGEQGDAFIDQLAECVNRVELRANFLIAIREDAYSRLAELFAGKVANIYGNHLQLEYLDREAAREAIVGPIEHLNRTQPGERAVKTEPALVDAVLDQVRSGEVTLAGPPGAGTAPSNGGRLRDEIETPYLQLVMSTLWRTESERGSRVLSLATLQELGGAQEIVGAHLDDALGSLDDDEREAAVDVFRYLVTPSGAKIVHAASDLAALVERPPECVAGLLAKLAQGDARIVRHVPPPAGKSQPDDRYEIFHDVLASPITAWRQRALAERRAAEEARERERLAQEARAAERRAAEEERRRRSFQRLAAGALALFVVAAVLGVLALLAQRSAVSSRKTAESRQLAASSEAALASDPELSTLLALEALHVRDTSQAEAALRDAVPRIEVLRSLRTGSLLFSAVPSPDGRDVLTAGADGSARVWNMATGRQLLALDAGRELSDAEFSPDGRKIVTASPDRGAIVWSAASGGSLVSFGQATNVEAVAFSPNGRLVATAGFDRRARIWDSASGSPLVVLGAAKGTVRSIAFAPDSRRVLTASEDGSATIWDIASGRRRGSFVVRGEAVDSASFTPDGRMVVTAGSGGTARLWDVGDGRQIRVFSGHTGTVYDAAFNGRGTQLVTASEDGKARIWDVASGRPVNELSGHMGTVRSARFTANGSRVVTASEDGTARIWDAFPRELRRVLGRGLVNGASFSRDGTRVVTAGYDGTGRVWDVSTGRERAVLRGHTAPLTSASFSPDGTRVVTSSEDGTDRIWDAASGRELGAIGGPRAGGYGLLSASFSADGSKIVTASEDGTAKIVPLSGGKIAVLGHPGSGYRVYTAAYSPDDRRVVTAGEDGRARIWDSSDGRQLLVLSPHGGILLDAVFSSDGRRVLTAGTDGTARIWDAARGNELQVLSGHSGPVTSAAFSQDGSKAVTSSADGTARIWDASSGKQLAILSSQSERVNGAAFSPDAESVLTASDEQAAIWSTELAGSLTSVERIAERRLTRSFTAEERERYRLSGR